MKYEFFPELFLRAPFYSFKEYNLKALDQILLSDEFKNALYLASPDFYTALEKKRFDYSSMNEKEIFSLNKYYNRMCFRTTPFGSFSSFTSIKWTEDKVVNLKDNELVKLHLLPDQKLRLRIFEYLRQQADHYDVRLNPMCYSVGNEFRFIKTIDDDKGHNIFTLDAIDAEDLNVSIVKLLKNKSLNNLDFLAWIKFETECSHDEAKAYLNFLLDEQFLKTENDGNIISLERGDFSGKALADLQFSSVMNFVDKIKTNTLNVSKPLPEVSRSLANLLAKINIEGNGQLFYCACERPIECGGIDQNEQQQLLEAIDVLRKISGPSSLPNLERFIADFKVRFDQQKVPLLIALDPDTGISYGNLIDEQSKTEMLEDIRFPDQVADIKTIQWTEVHQLMMKAWLMNTNRDSYAPISLTGNDVLNLKDKKGENPLPPTTSLMFRKLAGNKILLDSLGRATATSLIGRFSLFNDELVDICRGIAKAESTENPDIVFADIGQFSDSHVDNVNRRVRIYDYEIPINLYSTLPVEQQIRPDDLLVSVLNNEIILESVKLKRRVIPRLTSAYNHTRTDLSLFRILCDLQHQGTSSGFSLDLEQLFPDLGFYPAVEFGRTIISPAKWIIKEFDLNQLKMEVENNPLDAISHFRTRFKIPQRIMLGNHDQQLVFNLENEIEASFFIDCIKDEKKIVLKEFHRPDNSVVIHDKPVVNQFVAFLKHNELVYQPLKSSKVPTSLSINRTFVPGSAWLYLKLFCTPNNANRLLINIIKKIVDNNTSLIHKWFFIRYNEGGNHIRFRVNASIEVQSKLMLQIKELLESNNETHLIQKYQVDTYNREIERYGSDIISEVEDLFCAGSELVTEYIELVYPDNGLISPFQFGIMIISKMTVIVWDDIENQLSYLKKVTDNFLHEFAVDKSLRLDLDSKYRQLTPGIIEVLENDVFDQDIYVDVGIKLAFFLENWQALASKISSEHRLAGLLADIIHMQINRLFSVQQRKQELQLYFCIAKHLQSKRARLIKAQKNRITINQ
ncbi:lantibiotic dehydratase [Pedobacter sp. MC2016-24]|uniref:lantibiotic dehydratase n=1 Tax=Pedobacter sp. MC2016-24 TaxID=2780090 RepID=UPI00187F3E2C|nr:lantibiotic dehydratase [Pedobacter sp. MC2016-24]MBE9599947.1 lantibiotic dehydratase [Pedobacter sp. MC2016-24]